MWKRIAEFPDYEVSDTGVVAKVREDGSRSYPKIIRRGNFATQVSLRIKGSCRSRERSVARLVYAAFVGPLTNEYIVRHKDGNPFNNRPGNLYLDKHKLSSGNRHGRQGRPVEKIDADGKVLAEYKNLVTAADKEFYCVHSMTNRCNMPIDRQLRNYGVAYRRKGE